MPRIPPRNEPYSSPSRQQRHFKTKRDLIIRQLGRSSYLNGSHFAMLMVSARGEVSVFASDLFQPRLDMWLPPHLQQEARAMVMSATNRLSEERSRSGEAEKLEMGGIDLMTDEHAQAEEALFSLKEDSEENLFFASITGSPIPATASNHHTNMIANVPSLTDTLHDLEQQEQLLHFTTGKDPSFATRPSSPNDGVPDQNAGSASPQSIPFSEVIPYYTEKLHSLQQVTCKRVAKNWVKIIEPKKQSKYPYFKGQETKPPWWPDNVRHKEPDHLYKDERTTLMITILRSDLVTVNALEISTHEDGAFIDPERMACLREIFHVARGDAKRRAGVIPKSQPILIPPLHNFNTNTVPKSESLKRRSSSTPDTNDVAHWPWESLHANPIACTLSQDEPVRQPEYPRKRPALSRLSILSPNNLGNARDTGRRIVSGPSNNFQSKAKSKPRGSHVPLGSPYTYAPMAAKGDSTRGNNSGLVDFAALPSGLSIHEQSPWTASRSEPATPSNPYDSSKVDRLALFTKLSYTHHQGDQPTSFDSLGATSGEQVSNEEVYVGYDTSLQQSELLSSSDLLEQSLKGIISPMTATLVPRSIQPIINDQDHGQYQGEPTLQQQQLDSSVWVNTGPLSNGQWSGDEEGSYSETSSSAPSSARSWISSFPDDIHGSISFTSIEKEYHADFENGIPSITLNDTSVIQCADGSTLSHAESPPANILRFLDTPSPHRTPEDIFYLPHFLSDNCQT